MPKSLNLIDLITQASLLVQIVMALLLLASLLSWVIIFRMESTAWDPESFWINSLRRGFGRVKTWPNCIKGFEGSPERQGLEQIFYVGFLNISQNA